MQNLPACDLLIVVDSASLDRILCASGRRHELPAEIVNIDHHKSNTLFGTMNYNDERASSSCEIIYDITRILKVKLSPTAARTLYTGLYSETGGFAYANTTSRTLQVAAELMCYPIKLDWLVRQINAKTLTGTRLLGEVLATIKIEDGVGTMYVTKKMIDRCRARMSDTENFVSFLAAINEVRVAIFLREQDDSTRVSLRSNCRIDVDRIARQFGGGGHRLAAGAKVRVPLRKLLKAVSTVIREHMKKHSAGR